MSFGAMSIMSYGAASGGGGLDADTTTWAAQVVTNGGSAPSSTSKGYVDTLIKAIKGDATLGPSLNTKLTRLWVLANADNTASATDIQSLTSIVNPASAIATLTGSFTSKLSGYQSNTTTGFIDSKYNINTGNGAGEWTDTAASMGTYCLNGSRATTTTTNNTISMGVESSAGAQTTTQILPCTSVAGAQAIQSLGAIGGTLNHDCRGMFMISRKTGASTEIRQYTVGPATFNLTDTDSGSGFFDSGNIYICARNNITGAGADSFSTEKISVAFIGRALSTTDMNSLAGYINAYMTSLSLNVYT